MIATLSGKVRQKSPGNVIVDTGGVGFGITMPLSSYYAVPEIGIEVFLLIYTHVREDALTLFGFMTQDEKTCFEKLISISGIGPKLAINILSGISVQELSQAIQEGNTSRVNLIPGVGKKTAERIILELKDKVIVGESIEAGKGGSESAAMRPAISDTISALINLGYKEAKAEAAVKKAKDEFGDGIPSIEELIKKSLKFLSS